MGENMFSSHSPQDLFSAQDRDLFRFRQYPLSLESSPARSSSSWTSSSSGASSTTIGSSVISQRGSSCSSLDSSPARSSSSCISSSSWVNSTTVNTSLSTQRDSSCSSLTDEDIARLSNLHISGDEDEMKPEPAVLNFGNDLEARYVEQHGLFPSWYNPGTDTWMLNPEDQGTYIAGPLPLLPPESERRIVGGCNRGFEVPFPHYSAPLVQSTIGTHPRILLDVYSDRKIHFVGNVTPFIIRVMHAPKDLQLLPRMFEVTVQSPNGNMIPCGIRTSDSYIINSFVGTFKAEEIHGNYHVNVKMTIHVDKLARYRNFLEFADGCVRGYSVIHVSRNYGFDCQKECLRISCEYLESESEAKAGRRRRQGPTGDAAAKESSVSGTSTDDHPILTSSRLRTNQSKLWGLTCDLRNNNLFYADREGHQVYCVSPCGDTIFKFGQGPQVPPSQQLHRPSGIAYDETNKRLVVCDKDNHRICFFTLNGSFISSFGQRGHKNGHFEYPWDVAVACNGQLAVADSKNKRVQLFDRFGNYLNKYTVFETSPFEYRSQFDYPRGICFDNTASFIYVTDFNVNNVLKIPMDFSGHEKLLPTSTVYRPQGIQVDSVGNLLVADSRHDCIRHMNTRGEHLYTIREIVKQPVQFPVNVTAMAGGFIAALDGNGTITIF